MSAKPKTAIIERRAGKAAKSIRELIAEQGVKPLEKFEDLFGAGRQLWNEKEFAALQEQFQATRRERK